VFVRLVLASLALATLAACGPIQSTAALIDADVELEAARAAGAAQTSTYEFTGAEAYLKKAREVSGRAEYEAAARLARRSAELAKVARKNAVAASTKPQENP
jgi:outer membrane biogenesis lipoprotein LolB